jgi:hypothetical protein
MRPPLEADRITTRAFEPRGMTMSPFASLASRVTCASKVWPCVAVSELIASFVRDPRQPLSAQER